MKGVDQEVTPGHKIGHLVLLTWMAENNILNFKNKFMIKGACRKSVNPKGWPLLRAWGLESPWFHMGSKDDSSILEVLEMKRKRYRGTFGLEEPFPIVETTSPITTIRRLTTNRTTRKQEQGSIKPADGKTLCAGSRDPVLNPASSYNMSSGKQLSYTAYVCWVLSYLLEIIQNTQNKYWDMGVSLLQYMHNECWSLSCLHHCTSTANAELSLLTFTWLLLRYMYQPPTSHAQLTMCDSHEPTTVHKLCTHVSHPQYMSHECWVTTIGPLQHIYHECCMERAACLSQPPS